MNKCTLVGRIVKDLVTNENGSQVVVKFTMAVDRRFKDANGNYGSDFPNCVAFGRQAEFISKYFKKGMRIGIVGHIQTGSYTNRDGQKVYTTDVVVDEAEFVESKGASQGQQTQQASPPPAQQQYQQQAPPQQQYAPQQQYQQAPPAQDQGFMQIPPGTEEELPFV